MHRHLRSQALAHAWAGVTHNLCCCCAAGALYVFPQLQLPQKAVEAAKKEGKAPDFIYCRDLLQEKVTPCCRFTPVSACACCTLLQEKR